MKKCDWLLLAAILLAFTSITIKKNKVGDYYTDFYYDCIVTHKLQTSAGYKVYAKFILVLKLDDGRRFDINVSPSCWAGADIGERLTFKLRESEIEVNIAKERWGIFSFLLLFPVVIVLVAFWAVHRFI